MHIVTTAPEAGAEVDAVANQSAVIDMFSVSIDGGQSCRRGHRCNPSAFAQQHGGLQHDDHLDPLAAQGLQCAIEVIGCVRVREDDVQPELSPRSLQLLQHR